MGDAAAAHSAGGGGADNESRPQGNAKRTARVAVVITVTKDPKPGDRGYIDGAAVLAHTVRKYASKKWPTDLVAITMRGKVTRSLPALRHFGYQIKETSLKVQQSEIEGEELRNTIGKSGCCGMDELIKLDALSLTAYERVMVLDADSLLMANVDELYEMPQDAIFTMDHGLGGGCINGGFLVARPSTAVYKGLYAEVKKGNFQPGSAWGGKSIGWCYGGQTYQGLIAYYFKILHKEGRSWRAVDSLVYNNMVTATNDAGKKQEDSDVAAIKLTHFTVCQKPWLCFWNHCCKLCEKLYHVWWGARREYEAALSPPVKTNPMCEKGSGAYVPVALPPSVKMD